MTPAPPGAVPLDRLARRFLDLGSVDALYAPLSRIVAGRPDWLAMLWSAPAGQQKPNLWFAALHDRVLAGVAHPLSAYFASVGGKRAPDAALADALADFVAREHDALLRSIRSRSTQTNEIGRCAVLWPALRWIAQRHGAADIALLDVGCSAGLNLGVDRYTYSYGDDDPGQSQAGSSMAPHLVCRRVGPNPLPAPSPAPRIVARLGIDPAPVEVDDDVQVRWLRACIWPNDHVRAQRLAQAVDLARRERWPVRREADCSAAVRPWVEGLPPGVLPVVFNSWVLHYLEPAALARHVETMTGLVRERGVVWLSAEGPHLKVAPIDPPAPFEPGVDPVETTLWMLASQRGGAAQFEFLARSHAHGRWLQWLA